MNFYESKKGSMTSIDSIDNKGLLFFSQGQRSQEIVSHN